MSQNDTVDIQNFLNFTSAGLSVASFVQIRDSLIKRYKDVYGSDIDVSTGTADGIFINDLALIINNILQSVKTIYSNLNVESASGVYLDNLCALANIYRKQQTASTASIEVTYEGSESTAEFLNPVFVDKAGTEWNYKGTLSFTGNETKIITVSCATKGPVKAPAGWIYQTLASTYILVKQKKDAIVGQTQETDSQLKARRAQSNGSFGVTVLDSLVGALLEIQGIVDVKIYDNGNDSSYTAKDTTQVLPHGIYIILRQTQGLTIDTKIIGSIIYEKMTPGIQTTPSAVTVDNKSYDYSLLTGSYVQTVSDTCYWKQATPVNPEIKITITPTSQFNLESEQESILSSLIKSFNSFSLSNDISSTDCIIQASYADPQVLGKATYIPISATINSSTSYTNPDTYYNYTLTNSSISTTDNGKTYIISLK